MQKGKPQYISPGAPIKAIVFDLDGTLYEMQWFLRPIITAFLFPRFLWLPSFITIRKTFAGKDFGTRETLIQELVTQVARKVNSTPESIDRWIHTRFYPSFARAMFFMRRSRPDLNGTLHAIRNRNIRLAVYSDYSWTSQRLTNLGIDLTPFDSLESAEEAGALKPHPRPLEKLAQRLDVAPESVLMIGDRDDTDGKVSQEAGMQFLRVGRRASSNTFSWPQLRDFLISLR